MKGTVVLSHVAVLGPVLVQAGNTLSSKGSTKSYPVTVNGIDLKSASAQAIAAALSNGTLTSAELVDAYLQRIEANDRQGLNFQSIIEVAPSARCIAKKLDAERANGTVRSPIHGLPIIVKDAYNTDVRLGMNSTAGSFALLQGSHAKSDAFVVKKLRDAGAIILGKGNQDEWSGQRGAENSCSWSARGGRISAAYVEGGYEAGADPSGSSGGPAVAVSAGFAAASLGTDTEGSIIFPSSRAALFGLRPSTGITSRTGVIPISSSQDTTGPMGKSTWDIAALFEIMAAHDPDDWYSEAAEPFRHKNYTQFLDPDGFQGMRIGIPREPFWNQTQFGYRAVINPAMEATLDKLRELGAEIIDPIVFPNEQKWRYEFVGGPVRDTAGRLQIQYDIKTDMAKYLTEQRTNTSGMESLFDIIAFIDKNSDLETAPGICCQTAFLAADQLGPKNSSGEYWWAKWQQQQLNEEGIEYVFRHYGIDVMLVPSEGAASRLGAVGRLPIGNVPVGYDAINLPFGMSFVGQRYDEPTVLRAMSAYEAHFPARQTPPLLD